jgi:hypothetical protein
VGEWYGLSIAPGRLITEGNVLYLFIPWSRVLLEKLGGFQLVKKFPAFYGTRRFITNFTSARHCPYPEPDKSSPFPPFHPIQLPEYLS